ncbi:MAG TPA: hypothetical protein VM286_06260 [Candidatus Thermoplasmatota archaeon]|nr:hypothetical protein [Candidatus Thermoplasmatota archaeon]
MLNQAQHTIHVNTDTPKCNHTGCDLIPDTYGRERDKLLFYLAAGYADVTGNKAGNFQLWSIANQNVSNYIIEQLQNLGLEMAPWAWDAFVERITPIAPQTDYNQHLALAKALLTNRHCRFFAQFPYRLKTGGNVHTHYIGGTGTGKSSCSLAVIHSVNRIQTGHLRDHLALTNRDLPEAIKRIATQIKAGTLTPGQGVHKDEEEDTAGEGSATDAKMMRNLENQLRASQINLSTSSPTLEAVATTQGQMVALAWHPKDKWTLFLHYVDNIPLGVVAIRWLPEPYWTQEYTPWKNDNVDRTVAAEFSDAGLARIAIRVCQDQRFVRYLTEASSKPKLKDIQTALRLYYKQMLSITEKKALADFLHDVFFGWQRISKHFEEDFGFPPNEGMKQIALRCSGGKDA